jgi:hypothetical protein
MPLRRSIVVLALAALVAAFLISPPDSPDTAYNEADTPFAAVLTPSMHVSSPAARHTLAVSHHAGLLPVAFHAELPPLVEIPHSHPVSLPIILHVLLC